MFDHHTPSEKDLARHALSRVIAAWPDVVDLSFRAEVLEPRIVAVGVRGDRRGVQATFTSEALARDMRESELGIARTIERAVWQWGIGS